MGIGRLLLERALDSGSACRTIKLDATPLGEELYDKMEFADEYSLHRLTHHCLPALAAKSPHGISPIGEEHWESIATLDKQVFGADRVNLLKMLQTNDPSTACCVVRESRVRGFCLGRGGTNFHQVGPVVAGNAEDAILLAHAALRDLVGRAVVFDVPDAQSVFLQWLNSLGFVKQRSFIRMCRGDTMSGMPEQTFAICGPEIG